MVRTRPLTALLVAPAAALLLLLSGCAEEEPEPKFADEPSATPTVEEEETAEEFIRRWAKTQNAMQLGNTAAYREIAAECEPCMSTADTVDRIYKSGGFVRTEGIVVRSIETVDTKGKIQTFTVKVKSAPTEYQEDANGPLLSFEGGPSTYSVQIAKQGPEWKFVNFLKVAE